MNLKLDVEMLAILDAIIEDGYKKINENLGSKLD